MGSLALSLPRAEGSGDEGGTGVRARPSHSPSLPPGSFQAGDGRSDPRAPSPFPFILPTAGVLVLLWHRGKLLWLGINRGEGCGHSWWVLFGFVFFWLNPSQGSSNRRCWNTATASGKIKAWSRHWVGKCPFCCWWGRDWEPDLKLSHRDAKRSALSHPGADISSDSLAFVTTLCPTSSP